MNMPFGFGGFGGRSNSNTSLTPQQRRQQSTRRMSRGITGGMASGNTMGAMMGFMGLPWLSRGAQNSGHGGYGPPQVVSAWDFLGGGMGGYGGNGGGGGNPPVTGGDDPPLDPNNPGGGTGNPDYSSLLQLLYPPPIGTGAQWRNTMKYGA